MGDALFTGILVSGLGVGSDFSYEKYEDGFNFYRGFKKRHVIAARVAACGVQGDVPFFDLCYLGLPKDLRAIIAAVCIGSTRGSRSQPSRTVCQSTSKASQTFRNSFTNVIFVAK